MPDVQEVFRMTTQKIRPDTGFVDRQLSRQRTRTRNRKLGAVALAAVIGVVGFAVVIRAVGVGDEATRPAVAPDTSAGFILELGTGERTPLPADLGGGFYYTASPDGTTVVFTDACCEAEDVATMANINGTDARRLDPEGDSNVYPGAFSPDGTKLVYQKRPGGGEDVGDIYVLDLVSGRETQLTQLELHGSSSWFLAPTFSADGQTVLFQLSRTTSSGPTGLDIWSVPVDGGEPTRILRRAALPIALEAGALPAYVEPTRESFFGRRLMVPTFEGSRLLVEDEAIVFPNASPDGTRIVYGDGNGSVHVVTVASGEVSRVADGGSATWLGDDALIITPVAP